MLHVILYMIVFVPVFLLSPLTFQYLLYLPAKRIFQKIPPHRIYAVCLLINTGLLVILHTVMMRWDDPDESRAMDAFDGILWYLLWSPWYLGVLISCIVRTVKAIRERR